MALMMMALNEWKTEEQGPPGLQRHGMGVNGEDQWKST
jgi:hypothetical protein